MPNKNIINKKENEIISKSEKGITIISVTITIIILLTLTTIVVYSGINSIKSSKFQKFKIELQIVQAQVNLLNQEYKEQIQAGQTISIGKNLTEVDQAKLDEALAGESSTGYRYFDASVFEELGVKGIENGYLVNIQLRKAIAIDSFEYNGTKYNQISQINY